MTREYVEMDLPMDEGRAFYAWAIEHDAMMQLNRIERDGDGYIRQEINRLMKIATKELEIER